MTLIIFKNMLSNLNNLVLIGGVVTNFEFWVRLSVAGEVGLKRLDGLCDVTRGGRTKDGSGVRHLECGVRVRVAGEHRALPIQQHR